MNTDESKTRTELLNEMKESRQRLVQAEAVEKDLKREVEKSAHLASFPGLNPNPVLELDQKGNINYTNPATIRLFPDLAALGTKHPFLADWAQVVKELQSSQWGKTVVRDVVVESSIYEQIVSPVAETQIRIYARDITKRKRAEEELHENERKLKTIFEILPVGVSILDVERNIVYVNPSLEKILYISREGLFKGDYKSRTYLKPDRTLMLAEEYASARAIKEQKAVNNVETGVVKEDSNVIWTNVSAVPVAFSDWRVVVVTSDITERKQTEKALRESEQRYRTLFESAAEGILIADIEAKKLQYANPAICKMLGYSQEELIKMSVSDIHPKTSLEHVLAEFDAQARGEKALSSALPCLKKDGTIVYVDINAAKAIIDGRECNIGFFTDITKRKRAEEGLLESEARYRSLVHLGAEVSEAIVMLQDEAPKEGVQVFCNETWPRITGYSDKELLSMSIFDLMHPKDRENALKRHRRKMGGKGIPGLFEMTIIRKDGTEVPVEATSAHTTYQGKPANVAYIRDITERKQREKTLEFTRKLLEVANLGKELKPTLKEFVRVIHDYIGCDAVGIRVLDSEGNIPYQAYEGFSREFYESESPLSIKLHQCMCINVIKGDTDPSLPYYTEDGSFYINGTTAFLATVSEEDKGSTRNVCNEYGYESVALMPIRLGGSILGLLHIADKRTDMVPLGLVNTLEDAAPQIGLSIRRLWAEQELAEEKKRLEVTLRSTGDAVITTDMEGKVVLLNRVAEQLTGWTQDEAVSKPLGEVFRIIDEHTRKQITDPVQNVLKTGRIVGLINHAVLVSRDGSECIIADSGAPIHDEQGNLFGIVLVFRDITEVRKLEEEIQKTEKLQSVGNLAGGIAHDFNNYLTGIMGNISLAKRYVEPKGKAIERLEEAEKASIRARDLTQQLLTFSSGGAPIKKTISIDKIIEDTVGFALRGSNVRPEFCLPDNLWAIEADEGQISQVISNIVINADQAMPQGGIIKIEAKNLVISRRRTLPLPMGNYVEITIRDYGVGIAKEHLARIFEPFFTTKQKGSGLGLATSYSIIKKHGGHITVESKLGAGTTVHVYLPASMEAAPIREKMIEEAVLVGKGRILVMDDEETIREFLYAELTEVGYEVQLTNDGAEAIEQYGEANKAGQPFDAVILDLTIPGGMGGKEAIKKLLELDPDVKAIVSSGYATDPIMSEYKEYGFSAVVTKPYSAEQIEKTLQGLLRKKK